MSVQLKIAALVKDFCFRRKFFLGGEEEKNLIVCVNGQDKNFEVTINKDGLLIKPPKPDGFFSSGSGRELRFGSPELRLTKFETAKQIFEAFIFSEDGLSPEDSADALNNLSDEDFIEKIQQLRKTCPGKFDKLLPLLDKDKKFYLFRNETAGALNNLSDEDFIEKIQQLRKTYPGKFDKLLPLLDKDKVFYLLCNETMEQAANDIKIIFIKTNHDISSESRFWVVVQAFSNISENTSDGLKLCEMLAEDTPEYLTALIVNSSRDVRSRLCPKLTTPLLAKILSRLSMQTQLAELLPYALKPADDLSEPKSVRRRAQKTTPDNEFLLQTIKSGNNCRRYDQDKLNELCATCTTHVCYWILMWDQYSDVDLDVILRRDDCEGLFHDLMTGQPELTQQRKAQLSVFFADACERHPAKAKQIAKRADKEYVLQLFQEVNDEAVIELLKSCSEEIVGFVAAERFNGKIDSLFKMCDFYPSALSVDHPNWHCCFVSVREAFGNLKDMDLKLEIAERIPDDYLYHLTAKMNDNDFSQFILKLNPDSVVKIISHKAFHFLRLSETLRHSAGSCDRLAAICNKIEPEKLSQALSELPSESFDAYFEKLSREMKIKVVQAGCSTREPRNIKSNIQRMSMKAAETPSLVSELEPLQQARLCELISDDQALLKAAFKTILSDCYYWGQSQFLLALPPSIIVSQCDNITFSPGLIAGCWHQAQFFPAKKDVLAEWLPSIPLKEQLKFFDKEPDKNFKNIQVSCLAAMKPESAALIIEQRIADDTWETALNRMDQLRLSDILTRFKSADDMDYTVRFLKRLSNEQQAQAIIDLSRRNMKSAKQLFRLLVTDNKKLQDSFFTLPVKELAPLVAFYPATEVLTKLFPRLTSPQLVELLHELKYNTLVTEVILRLIFVRKAGDQLLKVPLPLVMNTLLKINSDNMKNEFFNRLPDKIKVQVLTELPEDNQYLQHVVNNTDVRRLAKRIS